MFKDKDRKIVTGWYKFIKNPLQSKEFQQRMDNWGGLVAGKPVGRLLPTKMGINSNLCIADFRPGSMLCILQVLYLHKIFQVIIIISILQKCTWTKK